MRKPWVALVPAVLAACSFGFPATPGGDATPPLLDAPAVTDTTVVPPADMAPPVDVPPDDMEEDPGALQQCGKNFIVDGLAVAIACASRNGVATCACKRLGLTFETCTSTADEPCELPTCCSF